MSAWDSASGGSPVAAPGRSGSIWSVNPPASSRRRTRGEGERTAKYRVRAARRPAASTVTARHSPDSVSTSRRSRTTDVKSPATTRSNRAPSWDPAWRSSSPRAEMTACWPEKSRRHGEPHAVAGRRHRHLGPTRAEGLGWSAWRCGPGDVRADAAARSQVQVPLDSGDTDTMPLPPEWMSLSVEGMPTVPPVSGPPFSRPC